jgi:hypothetical protein
MPLYAAAHNTYIATLAQKRNFSRASASAIARATEKLRQAGYDSVALDNGDGSFEFVVFDPAAVKSAIGNQGTFSPDAPGYPFFPFRCGSCCRQSCRHTSSRPHGESH